jgi:dimethylargininase
VLIAVTRPVSASLARCELTHLAREPIDVARATSQHAGYERLLVSLGAALVRVDAAHDLPDAVFVEDTAIVLDDLAVLTRPGAASREAETPAVASVLATYRPLRAMTAPATLDGGDVLRAGRTLFVGRSGRTSEAGIAQLRGFVEPHGYRVVPVAFTGCLHLKSAVTAIAEDLLLMNPAWVEKDAFPGLDAVFVDEREPHAANALPIGETVVFPAQFPRTAERVAARGLRISPIDATELAKAEGAVTCCSLIFDDAASAGGTEAAAGRA